MGRQSEASGLRDGRLTNTRKETAEKGN